MKHTLTWKTEYCRQKVNWCPVPVIKGTQNWKSRSITEVLLQCYPSTFSKVMLHECDTDRDGTWFYTLSDRLYRIVTWVEWGYPMLMTVTTINTSIYLALMNILSLLIIVKDRGLSESFWRALFTQKIRIIILFKQISTRTKSLLYRSSNF